MHKTDMTRAQLLRLLEKHRGALADRHPYLASALSRVPLSDMSPGELQEWLEVYRAILAKRISSLPEDCSEAPLVFVEADSFDNDCNAGMVFVNRYQAKPVHDTPEILGFSRAGLVHFSAVPSGVTITTDTKHEDRPDADALDKVVLSEVNASLDRIFRKLAKFTESQEELLRSLEESQ